MKRRSALGSLIGVGVAAQTPPSSNAPRIEDNVKLDTSTHEAVADAKPKFFSDQQFKTLTRLCAVILPSVNGRPSANDAGVPEFLDFLLAESPTGRQVLYSQGLDQLDINARQQHNKAFASTSASEAAEHLKALTAKWTWSAPKDSLARFLREAKNDILRASMNSRAWAEAAGGRRAAGVNTYWEVID